MKPRVRRRIQKTIKASRRPNDPWPARMGDGSGTVAVPGHQFLVYVRPDGSDLPMVVYGQDAPKVNDLPVWVGPDPYNRRVIKVLSTKVYPGTPYPEAAVANVGAHHESHEWGGPDVVYIDTKQIIQATVFPAGGLSVAVNPGYVQHWDGYAYIEAQLVDLTSYVPGSNMRFVLLQVDEDGAISVKQGDTFTLDLYSVSQIPEPDEGNSGLYAVRLIAGQTTISNAYANPDLIDLRWANLVKEMIAHADRHEAGGSDEIDLTGLSGSSGSVDDLFELIALVYEEFDMYWTEHLTGGL